MSGVLISYNNWVDLDGGVWRSDDGTSPPGISGSEKNLRNTQRASLWTGPAAALAGAGNGLGYDWPGVRKVRVLALLDHTFASSASAWLYYRRPDDAIVLVGTLSQLWASDEDARHMIVVLATPVDAKGVFFFWNQPGTTVSACRLWAGDVLDLSSVVTDVSSALTQATTRSASRGRQDTTAGDARLLRSIRLTLDRLPPALMWGGANNTPSLFDMLMRQGQSGDMLVLPAYNTAAETRRRVLYGALDTPVRAQRFRSTMTVSMLEV